MQVNYVNINGKLVLQGEAGVSYDNGAFRYGYGLFETILFRDGEIDLRAYHCERLFNGAVQVGLRMPVHMNEDWFSEEIKRTVKKNKLEKLCRVRLQVHAGSGGLFKIQNKTPGYIIECFALDEHITQLNEMGLTVGIASGLSKSMDSLANLKSCNAMIYAMAARQAKDNKWNDALVLNTSGNIIESAIANIFWVKDGVIYTPLLSEGCVAGTMRRKILDKLPGFGFNVIETTLTEQELLRADEVFLSNAIRRIKWIGSIDTVTYNHNITSGLYSMLFEN